MYLPAQQLAKARLVEVEEKTKGLLDEPGPGGLSGRDQDESLFSADQTVFVALIVWFPVRERDVLSLLLVEYTDGSLD